jgi:hypothetical protein
MGVQAINLSCLFLVVKPQRNRTDGGRCAPQSDYSRVALWRATSAVLVPDAGSIAEVGGPDFPQMEPTDQLDAPNRRLPESRLVRVQSGEPNRQVLPPFANTSNGLM